MSNYDFLKKYLINVCHIHVPVYYSDGTFSVLVEDSEGYNGEVNILFDSDGSVIDD